MTDTPVKCGMCHERDLERVSAKTEGVEFWVCPNCDSPKGKSPKGKVIP